MANKTVKGSSVVLICDEQGCPDPPLYGCKCEWCNKRKHIEDKYFSCREHLANNTQRHGGHKSVIPIWFELVKQTAQPTQWEYDVQMTALSIVTGKVRVRADSTDDARMKAREVLGNVEWKYEGLAEDSDVRIIKVTCVR
jgi:hypothetical protein